jgi:hypothetical protein
MTTRPIRKPLSRRTLLRGGGIAIGLPLLDAMLPVRGEVKAQAALTPKRFISYFVPNGAYGGAFKPAKVGDLVLSPMLEPLEPVRSKMSVISGCDSAPGDNWVKDPHPAAAASVLTAVKASPGEIEPNNGISVDQVIANRIGGTTRFRSLQLGAEGGSGVGDCDGYTCDHQRTISWAGPKTPLPKISEPTVLFDRLFGGAVLSPEEKRRRAEQQKSSLDLVLEDTRQLSQLVGSADRIKLDEFMTSLRELEQRANPATPEAAAGCTMPPPSDRMDHQALVAWMTDVMVLALRCDLTRVITFMWANAASELVQLGKPHHKTQTHGNFRASHVEVGRIAMGNMSTLLQKLDAIMEGDASVLDSTLLHYTSEFGDADAHQTEKLPIVLAGGAGGAVRQGQHLEFPNRTPVANMFLSVLRAFDIQDATFGDDGTAPLEGILA